MTLAKPGPIATRLVREVRKVKGSRVVDLRAFREGATNAAELQKSVATRDDLSGFHPAHALYVSVQNQVSVMAELLTALPATAKLADRIEAAVRSVLAQGLRTADIAARGEHAIGTREMGDAVVAALR